MSTASILVFLPLLFSFAFLLTVIICLILIVMQLTRIANQLEALRKQDSGKQP